MNIVPFSWPKRGNKYKNQITEVDGIKFDSKKEASRYLQLKFLEKAGEIDNLRWRVRYPFKVNGVLVCTYVADFVYDNDPGGTVVEDVKGFKTPEYNIKKKLMKACFGITVKET